jgi:putative hydrolase of the HAD superfamily
MHFRHVFFDIGGVLGTNGWDHEQRYEAVAHFGLSRDEFEYRHREMVGPWEEGRISIQDYLQMTVFHERRSFKERDFLDYMLSLSKPNAAAVGIAAELARDPRIRLMTMNNESSDLNTYRIAQFGLDRIFVAFLSSCWMGVRKPLPLFFTRGMSIAQAEPRTSLLIDDRPQNIQAATTVGMDTILFRASGQLVRELQGRGLLSSQPSHTET